MTILTGPCLACAAAAVLVQINQKQELMIPPCTGELLSRKFPYLGSSNTSTDVVMFLLAMKFDFPFISLSARFSDVHAFGTMPTCKFHTLFPSCHRHGILELALLSTPSSVPIYIIAIHALLIQEVRTQGHKISSWCCSLPGPTSC